MRRHVPELDGIRALAIAPVLLFHGTYRHFRGGFLGVDLFFVLSGFLITTILLEEHARTGRIHLRFFYARRALRILPPVLVGLALALALGAALPNAAPTPVSAVAPVLLFYANAVEIARLGALNHFWSLAVEEQFYFVWPAVLLVLLRQGRRTAVALLSFCALGVPLSRSFLLGSGISTETVFRATPCRLDALALGCLLALLAAPGAGRSAACLSRLPGIDEALTAVALGIAACFLWTPRESFATLTWGLTIFAVLGSALVASSMRARTDHPVRRLLRSSFAVWLGKRSYGIYVYHLPIFLALEPLRVAGDRVNFALVLAARLGVTLGFAELSFRFVERPLLALKRRFESLPPENALSGS